MLIQLVQRTEPLLIYICIESLQPIAPHSKISSWRDTNTDDVTPVASQAKENSGRANVKSSHELQGAHEQLVELSKSVAFVEGSAAVGCQPSTNKT
jgi:hypothetical protein